MANFALWLALSPARTKRAHPPKRVSANLFEVVVMQHAGVHLPTPRDRAVRFVHQHADTPFFTYRQAIKDDA